MMFDFHLVYLGKVSDFHRFSIYFVVQSLVVLSCSVYLQEIFESNQLWQHLMAVKLQLSLRFVISILWLIEVGNFATR